jgi:hypothetical protein
MGRNRRHSLPQVRLHSGSGHARVRINGTEHWLGRFGSPEAQAAYDRLLSEYLANGRQVAPKPDRQETPLPIVDCGRKRRRTTVLFLGGCDRGDSPDHTPFQREAQECIATWRCGVRNGVRC